MKQADKRPTAKWPQSLSARERLDLAKHRTQQVVDRAINLISQAAENEIILYSDVLAKQIPRSRAAISYRNLQITSSMFTAVRTAAIWDSCAKDRISLPTIAALIDDPRVIQLARSGTFEIWASGRHLDDEIGQSGLPGQEFHVQFAKERADSTEINLRRAITIISESVDGGEYKSILDARNNAIAHNLEAPHLGESISARTLKHGDEIILLEHAISASSLLHSGLNNTSFDWDETWRLARRNAKELWGQCHFEIAGRRDP